MSYAESIKEAVPTRAITDSLPSEADFSRFGLGYQIQVMRALVGKEMDRIPLSWRSICLEVYNPFEYGSVWSLAEAEDRLCEVAASWKKKGSFDQGFTRIYFKVAPVKP